jgi:hypothetical protein
MRSSIPAAAQRSAATSPHAGIGDHAATEQQSGNTEVAAGGNGLREQHVGDRFTEARRDIRHRHLLACVPLLLDPAPPRS